MKSKFKIDKSLVSYFFVALTGVLTQLVVSSISQKTFGVKYTTSIALGYFIAFVITFPLINRYSFTADNNGKIRNRILKYSIVSAFSCLITVYGADFCLLTIREIFGQNAEHINFYGRDVDIFKLVSHFFGMGASFIFNYVCHKRFTFKKTDLISRLLSRFSN